MIVAVIGIGGLAIWVEWWRYIHASAEEVRSCGPLSGLRFALAIVFPAIIGASSVELILNDDKIVRNLGIVFGVPSIVLALYLLAFGNPTDEWAVGLGAFGCATAVFVWWIASGLDEIFQDLPKPDDAVGGNPDRPLPSCTTKIRT